MKRSMNHRYIFTSMVIHNGIHRITIRINQQVLHQGIFHILEKESQP